MAAADGCTEVLECVQRALDGTAYLLCRMYMHRMQRRGRKKRCSVTAVPPALCPALDVLRSKDGKATRRETWRVFPFSRAVVLGLTRITSQHHGHNGPHGRGSPPARRPHPASVRRDGWDGMGWDTRPRGSPRRLSEPSRDAGPPCVRGKGLRGLGRAHDHDRRCYFRTTELLRTTIAHDGSGPASGRDGRGTRNGGHRLTRAETPRRH